jgi:hypothetical protein
MLAGTFSHAAATFVAAGRPAADVEPHETANPATVRHFA